MSTPHKATEPQWGIVRRWEKTDPVSSVILEVADRVAALENASQATTGESSAVAPDHVRGALKIKPGLYLTEVASDRVRLHPVTPDHVRGATGMVDGYERPTRQHLRSVWGWHGEEGVYDMGYSDGAAQATCPHVVTGNEGTSYCELAERTAAQPRQEEPTTPSPTYELTDVAPLLWVLWHHLGASSPVGQPIRRYLGMGQHDRMTNKQMDAATRWARESIPPPAPAGGLVERVAEEIYDFTGDHVDDNEASAVIRAVADWLDTRGNRGSAADLRQEVDRG